MSPFSRRTFSDEAAIFTKEQFKIEVGDNPFKLNWERFLHLFGKKIEKKALHPICLFEYRGTVHCSNHL